MSAIEWRLQWRGPALWIVVVLLGLAAAALGAVQGSDTDVRGDLAAVVVCEGLALVAAILLPFLFMRTFARDDERRVSPVLWIRRLSSAEYALGKALACLVLGLFAELPALLIGWAVVGIARGGVQSAAAWVATVPIVVSAGLLSTALALLCIRLLPWPVLGALLSSGLVLYFALVRTQTLLDPTNLVASTIYSSPSVGFGPDTTLVETQRWFVLALALLILLLMVLLFHFQERRAASPRVHRLVVIGAAALAVVSALVSLLQFQPVAAQALALGPVPAPPLAASVSHYQLEVTLDPGSGQLEGTARFLVAPAQPGQQAFLFALNPGLLVRHVAIADIPEDGGSVLSPGLSGSTAPAFTSQLGWTRVTLSGTQFAQGKPVQLTITYGGRLAFSRDDYATASPLYFGPAVQFGPDVIHDYIGQGIAFLEGTGDWYPLLWTEEASGEYLFRQAFDRVTARIPAAYVVRCSLTAAARTADGHWKVVDVRPGGVLPMAFLAVLAAPERMNLQGATVLYRGGGPTRQVGRLDQLFLEQAQAMDRWLDSVSGNGLPRTLTAVIVPLIRHPVIGPGLVLLPETPDPAVVSAASYSDLARYRVPAQEIADAWWLDAIEFRAPTPSYINGPPTPQTPNGGFLLFPPSSQLYDIVTEFSGAVITDRGRDHGFLAAEMRARRAYRDTHLPPNLGGNSSTSAEDYAQSEERMLALGLRGDGDVFESVLVLDQLERELGMERTTGLLRRFAADYAQTPAGVWDLVNLASKVLGSDFAPVAAALLPPDPQHTAP